MKRRQLSPICQFVNKLRKAGAKEIKCPLGTKKGDTLKRCGRKVTVAYASSGFGGYGTPRALVLPPTKASKLGIKPNGRNTSLLTAEGAYWAAPGTGKLMVMAPTKARKYA